VAPKQPAITSTKRLVLLGLATILAWPLVASSSLASEFGPSQLAGGRLDAATGIASPVLGAFTTTCVPPAPGPAPLGRFPRTIQLGGAVRGLVVSERSNHAFAFIDCTRSTSFIAMLDARSGAVLRTLSVPGLFLRAAVDDRANRLLVQVFTVGSGGDRGKVLVIDTRNDHLLATVQLLPAPMAVDGVAGLAFIQTGDTIVALDVRTVRLLPGLAIPNPPTFFVDTRHHWVYTVDAARLTAFDVHTGRELWHQRIHPCDGSLVTVVAFTQRLFLSAGGSIDNRLGQSKHGHFCVVDPQTRRLLHTVGEGRGNVLRILAVDQRAGVVVAGRGIVEISGATSPIFTVFVTILDPRDGRVVGRPGIEADTDVAVADSRTGNVYLLQRGFHTATVLMLDPHGWRSTVLAQSVQATTMALASRVHRLFLASPFSDTVTMLCTDKTC